MLLSMGMAPLLLRCSLLDGRFCDSLDCRLEILGRPLGGRPRTSRLHDSDERLGYRFSTNDSDTSRSRILIFD